MFLGFIVFFIKLRLNDLRLLFLSVNDEIN
jgi:hypothetical protein